MSDATVISQAVGYLFGILLVVLTALVVGAMVYAGYSLFAKMYSNNRQLLAEREHEGAIDREE